MTDFVVDVYNARGGLAEVADGVLDAVGDPASGLAPSVHLWVGDGAAPPSLEALHLGHPVLEQAMRAARGDGHVAASHFAATTARRGGLPSLVEKSLGFRNARPSFGDERAASVPVAVFHLCVSYLWDEKREEMHRIAVDTQTGSVFDMAVLDRAYLEEGPAAGAERGGIERAWDRVRTLVSATADGRAAALEREAQRHLSVERARLEAYFQAQLRDLERRMNAVESARRAPLQLKRDSVVRDLETRRRDLDEKFRVRISVRLCCMELIDVPRILLPVHLEARRARRDLTVSYNLLTHALDPLSCEACAKPLDAAYLCNRAHVVCALCAPTCESCRALLCATCVIARCALCATPICEACDGPCGTCSKRTCRRHRDACHYVPPPPPAVAPTPRPRKPTAPPPPASSPRLWDGVPRGVMLAVFGDLTAIYKGLDRALAPVVHEAEQRQFNRAVASIDQLLSDLRPDAVDLRSRLREVKAALRNPMTAAATIDDLAARVALQRKTGRQTAAPAADHGTPSPSACSHPRPQGQATTPPVGHRTLATQQLLTKVLQTVKAGEALIARAVSLAGQYAAHIDGSQSRIEGWAAAVTYVVVCSDPHYHNIRQQDAGAWFGVSAATVSLRCGDLLQGVN